jgi:hypothetical protein
MLHHRPHPVLNRNDAYGGRSDCSAGCKSLLPNPDPPMTNLAKNILGMDFLIDFFWISYQQKMPLSA